MNIKYKHNHNPVVAGADGLYPQDLFRDLLIHERKRSERTKRHFFFVTLDISGLPANTHTDRAVIKNIIKAVSSSSRQVDIKGWYEAPISIGIIYTEVDICVPKKILEKIKQTLAQFLPDGLASRIGITHSIFPEEDGKQWGLDKSSEAILYPPPPSQTLQKQAQKALKRILDITASSAGILVLSPLLLIVAFLIKTTSRGPVFFKQERVGLGGKKFTLFKFRSMQTNNNPAIHQEFVKKFIAGQMYATDPEEHVTYKIKNDPRITLIGRFIRKTSIDELPQLFNVLQGTMSLVGPRPPLAYEVEEYEVWHRPRVVEAKPGITGLWQVKGRSKTTFDGMVRMDLDYIHTWSLWLDIKLLFKTPAAVLTGSGAC